MGVIVNHLRNLYLLHQLRKSVLKIYKEFKINGKEVDFAKIINRFQEHFEEEMEKISKHSEREMISLFEERYAEVTKLVVEKLIKSKPYQSFEQEEV